MSNQHAELPLGNYAHFARELEALLQRHPLRQPGGRGRPGVAAPLAYALGVDPSLVRRWLRGEGLPQPKIVGEIADVLALSQEEKRRLMEVYSQTRKRFARPSRRAEELEAVSGLTARAGASQRGLPAPSPLAPDSASTHLPTAGAALHGASTVASAIISLLNEAATRQKPGAIYLTYNGSTSLMDAAQMDAPFEFAMRKCLQKGWNLRHSIRLDKTDTLRTINTIKMLLSYSGLRGKHEPYYLTDSGPLPVPYDLLVIPGIGAMLCFATRQADHLDAGIFLSWKDQKDQVALLEQHAAQLFEAPQAKPLLRSFSLENGKDEWQLIQVLADLEREGGTRFVMKLDGLSAVTRPPSFYLPESHLLEWRPSEERAQLVDAMIVRWQAFKHNALSDSYRDVCSRSSVMRYVEHGIFAHDDTDFTGGDRENRIATESERRDHLENVIRMLNDHKNYELALVDEAEEKQMLHGTQWEAVSDHGVVLYVTAHDEQGAETLIGLAITEPSVVKAFQAYGRQIWESISLANRDREQVIAWLKKQLEVLEVRMS